MKRIFRRLSRFQTAVLPGAVAAAIALPSGAVVAQPAMLEEVIVMAQKREQSLQDVGIAITAFSGEQLDSLGINSSTELSNITPNLNIVSPGGDGGVVAIFIRGIGLNDFSLNNTGPVGFYVDEVFAGSSNAQITTIFDTERVEVLKGPQGTLFGRNTTGGALNFISKKPEDQFGAEARVSYGNFDYYRLDGVVTGPMSDNVNGRLALVGYGTDGYIKNLSTGDTVERQNLAGRALFDYQPTDTLSFLLNLNASRNDSDSELYGTTADPDFYEGFHGDLPYKIKVDTYGGSLKASYDVTDTIGFTSITAYDNLDKDQNEDADMTPLQLVEISYQVESDLFTQELRLNGDTDNTHWIAGLYYLYEDMQFGYVSNLTDLGLGMSPSSNKQELQTAAAFGQIEYDFNERWALTAGARYTYIDIDFALDASFPILGVLGFQDENNFEDSQTDGQWSGKIGLDYTPTNDHLFYASIAKGFKGGGFNGGLVSDFANYPDIAEFDPEELLAYEIGMKSTFLDGSMRLNAAVFYYDYENAQVFNSVEDPVLLALPQNVVQNADELSIWGFDADFNWRPIDAWSITAGLGYTKSEFEDFELNVPGLDGIQTVQLQGETPQNTPEWSFSLQTSYTFGLGEAGSLTAYLDGSYRSEVLFSNGTVQEAGNPDTYFRNEEIGEDAYTLVNARLAWMDTSQQWEVALWGRNLADKEYAVYMFELTGLIGADQVLRGTPRTYGVDLRYVF